jgi:L-lactate utilization protein LutC
MTAEETLLNHHLEDLGLEVTETDLGEWIIQLRHEGPTHMVMPAIHLSRHQVADLFSDVTGHKQEVDIQKLVKVARRELRRKFAEADMGISGGNFAISETGTIAICTNEGNGRLTTTLPRVHVALVGLDKLTPTIADALRVIKALPRNATGQAITSYVSFISGANECKAECQGGPCDKKEMHVVFLDNGRRALAKDPLFLPGAALHPLRGLRQRVPGVPPGGRAPARPHLHRRHRPYSDLLLSRPREGQESGAELHQLRGLQGRVRGRHRPAPAHQEVHARIQDEEGHPLQASFWARC